MIRNLYAVAISASILLLSGCIGSRNTNTTSSIEKIRLYTNEQYIDLNIFADSIEISGDTLFLYSWDEFISEPFGIQTMDELITRFNNSTYYKVDTFKAYNQDSDCSDVKILDYKDLNNRMIFESFPYDYSHCLIMYVDIIDTLIELPRNIKIGMSRKDFFKAIGYSQLDSLTCNVIQLNTPYIVCPVYHNYTFSDNTLRKINMRGEYNNFDALYVQTELEFSSFPKNGKDIKW